jgi:hypothetical protein
MSIALLRNINDASSAMSASLSDRSDPPSAANNSNNRPGAFLKSNIDVNLSNHFSSKVYTSSAPISGNVTITTKREVPFSAIQILLMGTTRTRIDGIGAAAHDVTHTFLKMNMPIPESTYPTPRTLETGHTYTIPFNFVVPRHLTINACNHEMLSSQLQDHHVLLPPSMGTNWAKDDMSPQMARVEYAIKARVLRLDEPTGKHVRVMEAVQLLNVLPETAEEPPLNITAQDTLYTMTKTKTLRRNLLSSKLGRITARAIQPSPAILGPDGQHLVSAPTARVELHFEPAGADVPPPRVTSASGKLTAHTYYSSGTIPTFPNLGDFREQQFAADKRGVYATSTPLPALPTPATRWKQHLTSSARRDSGYSSNTEASEDSSSSGPKASLLSGTKSSAPVYHTATVDIPLALPVGRKTLVPTFHSCIASRVYTVALTLQMGAGGGGSGSTTVQLTVPLQIGVGGGADTDRAGLPSFETAVEEAEADEHLRPRVVGVPEQQYQGGSVLPGYA